MRLNSRGEKRKRPGLTSEEKRDRSILRLGYGVVFGFLCLMLYMWYFLTVQREDVINNPYNARLERLSERVERGALLCSDGTVLARTQTDEEGRETRVYPYGSLFDHVVGYSSRGRTGLESLANFYLLSSHINLVSQAVTELSGRKNPGDSVVTTLDRELQQTAGDALGDRKGAVVVMEPDTGKILALVSKPGFDPNLIESDWETLVSEDDGQARLLNRALQGLYPPGSVFKMVIALEYIREHPDDYDQFLFECDGYFEWGDYTIQCYHGNAHGSQDLFEAFANSCNGAFAAMGLDMNLESLGGTTQQLKFNGEQPLPLPYSQSRFAMEAGAGDWEILQTSIGQGLTQVTPMHIALITSAAANRGVLMTPYLMDYVENRAGDVVKSFQPREWGNLMTEEEAGILGEMMRRVVTEGTGSALRTENYTAAGKTGSSQFETGKESHAWFTGFAPAENPELVVTVIVEEGGSGGLAAAPVARTIFDAYFAR